MRNGQSSYMFKWHAVEESLPCSKKFFAINFGVLLELYYSSLLATAMLSWPTDGGVSVDTHVAWPHCMCIASRYCRNFLRMAISSLAIGNLVISEL